MPNPSRIINISSSDNLRELVAFNVFTTLETTIIHFICRRRTVTLNFLRTFYLRINLEFLFYHIVLLQSNSLNVKMIPSINFSLMY